MSTESAIPCIIYAAKSTEDKRGSIAEQLSECREAIESDPRRRLVSEYSDEAFSGYRRDRGPGLVDATQHAEDLAAEHGTAELWAQHSDRIARGDGRAARHTVEIALWALKHDVRVRTLQDPDTFRDLLYAVVTGQRNNEDSKRKAISSQAGRKRALARGEYVGHLPDGYVLISWLDERGQLRRRLEFDPRRKPVIDLIFRLALRGRTSGQIAKILTDRGYVTKPVRRIDTPRPFDVGKVYELLRNPRYAALSTYRAEIVARGHWPAYITERQRERIVTGISLPRPRGPRRTVEAYLLAGVARCGHCGHGLRLHSGRRAPDGTYTHRYVCGRHINSRGGYQCPAPPIRGHSLEAMAIANLDALLRESDKPVVSPTHELDVTCDERARLRRAILAGDHEALEDAIAALFARMQPYASLAREGIHSQRGARELADAERLRVWLEQEAQGRTDATRAQVVELNRLVRAWFAHITVRVDPAVVTLSATRRRGASAPPPPAEVQIDRAAWTRAAPPDRRGMTLRGTWERAEIIGALQAWAVEHGRSPRRPEWRLADCSHPCSWTVCKRLGSWSEALAAAGLAVVQRPSREPWTSAEIIAALRQWASEHRRSPTHIDWLYASAEHPNAQTVCRHFQSWRGALAAAGLDPSPRPGSRNDPWSTGDLVAALRAAAERDGRAPTSLEWIRAAPGRPASTTVRKRFGGWKAALRAAGLAQGAS